MVGILPRLPSGRRVRRSLSMTDMRELLPQIAEVATPTAVEFPPAAHGIETAVEFKPVEHPAEPLSHEQPVKCPLPEPSILNDGRIWKERMSSASIRVRSDLPVVNEEGSQLESEASVEGLQLESEAVAAKPPPVPRKRAMLPSVSAPEHHLLNLLEECNFSGDQIVG